VLYQNCLFSCIHIFSVNKFVNKDYSAYFWRFSMKTIRQIRKHVVKLMMIFLVYHLLYLQDSRVAVKACEGLILCSSLPDPVAAHCLVNSTNFCQDLTQRLVQTYKKLPSEINPMDLENVQAKWGYGTILNFSPVQFY